MIFYILKPPHPLKTPIAPGLPTNVSFPPTPPSGFLASLHLLAIGY